MIHHAFSAHIHLRDVVTAAADDKGIQEGIKIMAQPGRRLFIQYHQIRAPANRQHADRFSQGRCTTVASQLPERRS